jgi:hypothetical protein
MSDSQATSRPFQYSLWSLVILVTLAAVVCSMVVTAGWIVPVLILLGVPICILGFGPLSRLKHPGEGAGFVFSGFLVRLLGLSIIGAGVVHWIFPNGPAARPKEYVAPQRDWKSTQAGMRDIVTPDDLKEMLADTRAVVFVDVDWSLQTAQTRRHVHDFIKTWSIQTSTSGVTFYRLDMTEQSGELYDAVNKWLEGQPVRGNIVCGGYGSLIWVSKGNVRHSLINATWAKTPELIQTTADVFSTKNETPPQ